MAKPNEYQRRVLQAMNADAHDLWVRYQQVHLQKYLDAAVAAEAQISMYEGWIETCQERMRCPIDEREWVR